MHVEVQALLTLNHHSASTMNQTLEGFGHMVLLVDDTMLTSVTFDDHLQFRTKVSF